MSALSWILKRETINHFAVNKRGKLRTTAIYRRESELLQGIKDYENIPLALERKVLKTMFLTILKRINNILHAHLQINERFIS